MTSIITSLCDSDRMLSCFYTFPSLRKPFVFVAPTLFSCLSLFFSQHLAAQDAWVQLSQPQSDLLGRPLQQLTNGSVSFIPDANTPTLNILTTKGPDYTKEYKERFRKLIIPAFSKTKFTISSVELKNTQIKFISPDDFRNGNLQPGTSFAYEAICADTITIQVKYKGNVSIKPAEILDTLKKYIPVKTVATDIVSLASKVEIVNSDSLYDEFKIYNPGVFFRARFITFVEGLPKKLVSKGRTWDDYWKHFYQRGKSDSITLLKMNQLEVDRKTVEQYPEAWGPADPKNRTYFLKGTRTGNELSLSLMRNTINGPILIIEIPYTIDNGIKTWELDYQRVDQFSLDKSTKLVFISCYATQVDANTIKILNYRGVSNDKNNIATYMKYPQYKISFITKYK